MIKAKFSICVNLAIAEKGCGVLCLKAASHKTFNNLGATTEISFVVPLNSKDERFNASTDILSGVSEQSQLIIFK
jgi:hypothetical protein